jgi:hypothetical protein
MRSGNTSTSRSRCSLGQRAQYRSQVVLQLAEGHRVGRDHGAAMTPAPRRLDYARLGRCGKAVPAPNRSSVGTSGHSSLEYGHKRPQVSATSAAGQARSTSSGHQPEYLGSTPLTVRRTSGCGHRDRGCGQWFQVFDRSDRSLWVPNWSSTSCDLGVFVYQPIEPIATSEVELGWRRRRW